MLIRREATACNMYICLFHIHEYCNHHPRFTLLSRRCCCAEWVDEGLSVHVKFNVPSESTANNVDSLMAFNVPSESTAENADPLIANGIFVHYFAESELDKYNQSNDLAGAAPFDGLSCSKK